MADNFHITNSGPVGQQNIGGTGNTNTVNITKQLPIDISNILQQFQQLKEDFSKKLEESLDALNISEKETKEIQRNLQRTFPKFSVLDPRSQKLITSGEYLYKNIDQLENGDFSPAVFQYGRAIENELVKKLGVEGNNMGQYQNNLIKLLLEYHNPNIPNKRILNKIEPSNLSKNIFTETYLGYSIPDLKNLNEGIKDPLNDFYQKIRKKRNSAGHSGDDSFFTQAQANEAINDMTSFLKEWTEVRFIV